ncbi:MULTISPECIES: DISARM system SNF2-like helicase DrmD [Nostocales]|uniref:Helicase n=2 Tax=Tolypothrix TaxID=111782 RepID=A0A0C1N5H4_9CYAN
MNIAVRAIPEQGQIVSVRSRRFVVTNVQKSSLSLNPILDGVKEPHHLVSLASLEDDALGETLQVIWDLEPGATVYEKVELPSPDGFDEPEVLDAFLDAVRWGAASSADVHNIQSPFRSGIDIEDYQLDPVVRAIQMPRVNLLVADDVGLGKTIEAGLVAQELILRQRVRKVLIVCPSSLQIQWREQMRDKFGLDFRIVDSELMRELRRRRGIHVNPWSHFPRLITSIDFLKRDRPLRLFREVLPAQGESIYPRRFDLLIVDEAHNVAPSGGGNYAVDSMRTAAIRLIEPHFEHKLFLSATPHNGYLESFTALLELLDNQRFARGVMPDPNQLRTVMVRRLKSELPPRWDGKQRFPGRFLEAISVDYTDTERQAHKILQQYTQLRRKGAVDNTEKYATEFVLKLLKKRLFSSPAAFAMTLEQHEKSLNSARRGGSSSLSKPTVGILRRQLEQIEEDFASDEVYEESEADALDSTTRLFRQLSQEEQALLQQLRTWAEAASRRFDSKAQQLFNWIEEYIRPGGNWSNERVIIFTEYRTTQKWLYEQLAAQGLTQDERVMLLYGGMNAQERERVKAAFQANPETAPVRILLATDAASEGLDLQNFCSKLIHWEIPWNPNRMEQRNGRIDRHGQKADRVLIYHFVGQSYQHNAASIARPGELEGDLEFLMRAALKVNNIREDLGKVGPVIAQQVEEAMLGARVTLDTTAAERDSQPVRRMLKFERQVRERIEQLREQLSETRRNLRLTPENIESVVRVGLELAEQPPLIPASSLKGRVFHLPPLKASWAACSEGLAHPHTKEIRPIVFDPDLAHGKDDVVLVHLNHRLVQMCLRLLRAEVWSQSTQKRLHRVTARMVKSSALDNPCVIACGRLVILGSDQQRLHEEVITAGGILKEGRFSRMKVGEVQLALEAVTENPVPEAMKAHLAQMWFKNNHTESLMKSLEVRMGDRTTGLQKSLLDRCEKEVKDITAILTELQQNIAKELQEPKVKQLELFTTNEREQLERNINSLKKRLEQIPLEIKQETDLIRKRFSNSTPRLFPLAVTYLVPEKIARQYL